MEERVRVMEWKMERKEREERRRNVGLKVEERKVREEIEKMIERIGAG